MSSRGGASYRGRGRGGNPLLGGRDTRTRKDIIDPPSTLPDQDLPSHPPPSSSPTTVFGPHPLSPPDIHFVAPLRTLRLSDHDDFGSSITFLHHARTELNKALHFAAKCEKYSPKRDVSPAASHPSCTLAKSARRQFHLYWTFRVRAGKSRPSGKDSKEYRLQFRSQELTEELEKWKEHCGVMGDGRLGMVLHAGHEMEYVRVLALQRLREGVKMVEDVDSGHVEGGWEDKHRGPVPGMARRCLDVMEKEEMVREEAREGEGAQWYRLLGNPLIDSALDRYWNLQRVMGRDDVDFPEPWKGTHQRMKEYDRLSHYIQAFLWGNEDDEEDSETYRSPEEWREEREEYVSVKIGDESFWSYFSVKKGNENCIPGAVPAPEMGSLWSARPKVIVGPRPCRCCLQNYGNSVNSG